MSDDGLHILARDPCLWSWLDGDRPWEQDREQRVGRQPLADELEAMVRRWYKKADKMREEGYNADYHATRTCADELAITIEQYGINHDQIRHGAGQDMMAREGGR